MEDFDSDTWTDWDERCHGPCDTAENREQWPEGFMWSCCEEDGEAEGCKTGRHVEKVISAKCTRY